MPRLDDITDHEVIGPLLRQGRQDVLRRQLEKRFGQLPAWVETRLKSLPAADLAVRIPDAQSTGRTIPAATLIRLLLSQKFL